MTALGRLLALLFPPARPAPAPPPVVTPPALVEELMIPPLPRPVLVPDPVPPAVPPVPRVPEPLPVADALPASVLPAAPVSDVPALAVELICNFETLHRVDARTGLVHPYLDSGGLPTIGWGCTSYEDGRKVRMTDAPLTRARADALKGFHLQRTRDAVREAVPGKIPERHYAALLSLCFNIGPKAFRGSTCAKRYAAGDWAFALAALEWWNQDNGVVVRGLQVRRRAERLVAEGLDVVAARAQGERDFPKR